MSAKIVREKKGRCTNMDEIDEAVKEILEVCPKYIPATIGRDNRQHC